MEFLVNYSDTSCLKLSKPCSHSTSGEGLHVSAQAAKTVSGSDQCAAKGKPRSTVGRGRSKLAKRYTCAFISTAFLRKSAVRYLLRAKLSGIQFLRNTCSHKLIGISETVTNHHQDYNYPPTS